MSRYLPILSILVLILPGCENKSADDLLAEAKKFDSTQNYTEAILLYDKILKLDINSSDIFFRRAIDKELTKDTEGEIRDLMEILKSDPGDVPSLFHLGVACQNLKRYRESIELLSKAITIKESERNEEPKEPRIVDNNFIALSNIYFVRGMTYYKVDSIQKAVSDFSSTIGSGYATKECFYYRGCAFLKLKMMQKACADLTESLSYGMNESRDSISKYCKERF